MKFRLYGENWKYATIEEVKALAEEGEVVARVENPYCLPDELSSRDLWIEVARWQYGKDVHSGQWCRWCRLDVGDILEGHFSNELENLMAAHKLVEEINYLNITRRANLIHRMPDYQQQ